MDRSANTRRLACAGGLLLAATLLPGSGVAAGPQLLQERCGSCHERQPDGSLARIDNLRKSPEGWDMTLVRMRLWHGVVLAPEEQATLVRHLADTQGLAPEESAPYRAVIERRPDHVEPERDPTLTEMCARCHTYARFGLQRRDRDEWLKLAHTHLGQWPTIEYQALARDRPWWQIATSEVPDLLARNFPLDTAAWRAWRQRPAADLAGRWTVAGDQPGRGSYAGTLTVTGAGETGRYRVAYDLAYADGGAADGDGVAVVYTGYEWRGSVTLDGAARQEVLAVAADGNHLAGRWFLTDADEIGGDLRALRQGAPAELLAVQPGHLKAGTTATLRLLGSRLEGTVEFGPGIRVLRVLEQTPAGVTVEVAVAADAAPGPRAARVGAATDFAALTVYRTLDTVRVEPPYTIARVGGNGGPVPKVDAQFQAVGYLNGEDGEPGTADDLRVGVFPATWSTRNHGEAAVAMDDARFAGQIDASGLFRPGPAGPNPARPMAANNVGDLTVVASVDDGGRTLEGNAHLIVTVQRWNDPPLR